ncbi:MAG TPA: PepSY-associated TM helix domain-containing protein [Verrucomicrobiae bacterium]|nr:PepSY-associated TM helix domain-containing protein [Verrucomicrobiae bacterium]
MRFRQITFWLHLIAGIIAGVVIFIMSATGVALAFEKEIIAWAERDVRRVVPPQPDTQRLGLDELLNTLREQRPGGRPSTITLDSDANAAVLISFGRTNTFYVDPYTGAIRDQGAPRVRAFMQTMIAWHRFLGGNAERRAVGKAITGAGNAAFLLLAVSGLYLWWPRQWTRNALRAVGLMNFKLRGKPRDWNWHNAVGLWCAPVLIVLTVTALPISYRWAGDMIYKITSSTPPAPGGGAALEVPAPPADAKPLGMAALFAAAQKEFPQWKQISYRGGGAGGRTGRGEGTPRPSSTGPNASSPNPEGTAREQRESNRRQPVTLAVVEKGQWPLFSSTQLTLDPFTGAVLRKESFGDQNPGRQVRSWTRFLHTGEALGFVGKAVAALASAGAVVLVWTGLALAWRRFFFRNSKA